MPHWMPDWFLPGLGLLIANIGVWIFAWGRRTGGVNQRLKSLEDLKENPVILPECSSIFSEIKGGLSELKGKVSTILLIMTENQENLEKKHSKKRGKQKD